METLIFLFFWICRPIIKLLILHINRIKEIFKILLKILKIKPPYRERQQPFSMFKFPDGLPIQIKVLVKILKLNNMYIVPFVIIWTSQQKQVTWLIEAHERIPKFVDRYMFRYLITWQEIFLFEVMKPQSIGTKKF